MSTVVLFGRLLARLFLPLELFDRFLVVRIAPTVRDRGRRLASLFQNPLAVLASARHELALLLDLPLDLSLFVVDELLFALQVLRHSLLYRLKPSAHLLRLSAHLFGLESTALCCIHLLLFLHADDFLAWFFGIPQILLVVVLARL